MNESTSNIEYEPKTELDYGTLLCLAENTVSSSLLHDLKNIKKTSTSPPCHHTDQYIHLHTSSQVGSPLCVIIIVVIIAIVITGWQPGDPLRIPRGARGKT